LSSRRKLLAVTSNPYQAITRQTTTQATPMKNVAALRPSRERYIRRISTKTCPFSRTSHGAPRQGMSSSAYSVKVKKCAELW